MKEEQAKLKWCPHTRMVFGYSQGTTQPFNRFAAEPGDEMEKMQEAMNGTSGTKCIGSDCMMWVSDSGKRITSEQGESIGETYPKDYGHCGLVT